MRGSNRISQLRAPMESFLSLRLAQELPNILPPVFRALGMWDRQHLPRVFDSDLAEILYCEECMRIPRDPCAQSDPRDPRLLRRVIETPADIFCDTGSF